jgi:hypothetical protein
METPMTRRFIFPLLVLLPACRDMDKQPMHPGSPTFTIAGRIHDLEDRRLLRANADVLGTTSSGRRVVSDVEGYFSIRGVAGAITLRIWKEGYETFYLPLFVHGDTTVDVTLPRFEYADTLILGRTTRSYVSASAAPCDPVHWDAHSPCRLLHFFPPASGKLELTVSWHGDPPLDVTLVAHEGEYIASSTEPGAETAALEAFVVVGTLYEIRINSYYDYQEFDLLAKLVPNSAHSAATLPRAGALKACMVDIPRGAQALRVYQLQRQDQCVAPVSFD